jgi:hypothetical protein
MYAFAGREALQLCRKAVQIAPNAPETHYHLSRRYNELGFYESGIAENDAALARDSLFIDPCFFCLFS